jgi:hypothetical protein
MTEVLLAALVLQTLWFILFATFTTVGARNERRQFWKRRKNRKLEFTGVLQSWIKRIATLPRAIFWFFLLLNIIGNMCGGERSPREFIQTGKLNQRRHFALSV